MEEITETPKIEEPPKGEVVKEEDVEEVKVKPSKKSETSKKSEKKVTEKGDEEVTSKTATGRSERLFDLLISLISPVSHTRIVFPIMPFHILVLLPFLFIY